MIENVQINKAAVEDASVIADILYNSFKEFEPLYTPEAFIATVLSANGVLERMKEGNVWIAIKDEVVLGTAACVAKQKGLYIRGIAVLPEARDLKIAQRLLKEVEIYAINNDYSRMFLTTTPFLYSAIHLYEQYGFRRTNEGPDNFFGTDLFTMEKVIKMV
jgi:ribosomal protein S18 acetylase RimI-like enzyme